MNIEKQPDIPDEDRDLVQGCIAGEERAWEEFYERFHRLVSYKVHKAVTKHFSGWRISDEDYEECIHTVWNALASTHSAALIRDYDIKSSLGDIQAPTLVIVGDDDFIVPISQARILQQGIPNAEIAIIEDSGHFSYIEKPKDFRDAICQWLFKTDYLPQ